MKRVAITGISGYIGNLLIQSLDKRNDVESIIGLSRTPPKSASSKLKFFPRSVQESFTDIFADNGVDSAIHLAFVVPPAKDRDIYGINIKGTQNFLDACRQTSVESILLLSSHTVYGPHPDNPLPISEDWPLRPMHSFPYSCYKAQAEQMFQDFMESHTNRCITILRTCAVIGPAGGSSGFNVLMMPIMIRVMGYDPPWQFVHDRELAETMLTLVSEGHGGIFNVGGTGSIRYSEIIAMANKPSIVLPASLLSIGITLSWRLHLQSSSPVGGLEFLKYPIIVSTEKLERTTSCNLSYSSRDAFLSLCSAKGVGS